MLYLAAANLFFFILILLLIAKCFRSRRRQKICDRMMEHVRIGYYRYRCTDGIILAANESFCKLLELEGITEEDVIGRSLNEFLISVEEEERLFEQQRRHGELRNYEYGFKTLKGKDKRVLYSSYIDKMSQGDKEIINVFMEDVTEEKFSYEKMRESEERYEKLFKNSGDMVIIFRLDDFTVEEVNPITEVVTGFSQEELVGQSLEVLFHPSQRKNLRESQKDLYFSNSSRLETVIIVCKNGAYKEMSLTLSVVEIKEDRKVMAVVKDVSSLVREREEQTRRKKELEDFWKASVEREERM